MQLNYFYKRYSVVILYIPSVRLCYVILLSRNSQDSSGLLTLLGLAILLLLVAVGARGNLHHDQYTTQQHALQESHGNLVGLLGLLLLLLLVARGARGRGGRGGLHHDQYTIQRRAV